jgi:DENN (AEX-3) domain
MVLNSSVSRSPPSGIHMTLTSPSEEAQRLTVSCPSDTATQANSMQLLRAYYQQDVPSTESRATSVQLPGAAHDFSCQLPNHEEERLLTDWCIPTLLSIVPLERVLLLLTALLLETQVVFVSSNKGVLTATTMATIPLLRPLVWQGPLIPLLPAPLNECLHAPVPGVAGTSR